MPRQRAITSSSLGLHYGALALLLLSAGCADMPIVEERDLRTTPPRLISGPYLTETETGDIVMRFRTNRRCVAGIRLTGEQHRVERFATFNQEHAIRLLKLKPETTTTGRILLDDVNGPSFRLRGPPRPGGPVSLVFAAGRSTPDVLAQAAQRLRDVTPDAVLFCDPPMGLNADAEAWRTRFLAPLASLAARVPFYFPPAVLSAVPASLYPRRPGRQWSRDFGCVHLIALDAKALRNPEQREQVLAWLDQDLAQRRPSALWTVLLLDEPLFSARYVNARALDSLGSRLERWGVHLVISGGLNYYHRTLPLRTDQPGRVRYITLGGLGKTEAPGTGREYTAALSGDPHVALLRADQGGLEWKVLSLRDGVVDALSLLVGADPDAIEPSLPKQDILTKGLATLALRYETVAVARQICRAVPNPNGPVLLSLRLTNPSPRPYRGRLVWGLPHESAWRVEPASMRFDLAPGQVGRAQFKLTPTRPVGPAPILTVDAGAVGHVRQPLVITKLRQAQVPLVEGACKVDGYFNEPFWKDATEVSGFKVLYTRVPPSQVMRSWLAAGPDGLRIACRCEEKRPGRIKVQAKQHDGPIYRDESVEVFVEPSRAGRGYYQFAVNVKGVALDRSSRLGLGWNPKWQHAVQYGKTKEGLSYYDVEILIPYRAVGVHNAPAPGTKWALNLTRNDYHIADRAADGSTPAPTCEIVQWAPTHGSNARSGLYAVVEFVRPAAADKARTR